MQHTQWNPPRAFLARLTVFVTAPVTDSTHSTFSEWLEFADSTPLTGRLMGVIAVPLWRVRSLLACLMISALLFAALSSAVLAEEINLVREGGVYHLPVTLNDQLTVKFIVDTGAAETTIPVDVALVLMRTETVSDSDMLGPGTYRIADGSIIEQSRIQLRNIQVGNTVLHNISASVGDVSSPLLLGQNVLGQLEPWHLDTRQHRFVIGSAGGITNHDQATLAPGPSSYGAKASFVDQRQRIREFIEAHLRASASQEIEAFLRAYASRVDYYDRGWVARAAIRKDKAYYFNRWPQRSYQLAGPIEITANVDGSITVQYETNYSVYSPSRNKSARGRSRETLTLEESESGLLITSETSQVVRRE